ncbi:prolyl oligopeptidase family serine peptidase [Paraglaciecola arctica]|uniref:prolyl oligopeptidase family serine peptidase n=1 Tax=Paraglaciecola arctica TaxID=1128911 RepID=UPI001C068CBB|nr:prolyl oligopeptidase family serine peptidase [Paraglaciecola arctica]MBU3002816.1 prolyl oligopeptidase family serine peptidase [Paraglaciecola arctica]
MKTNLLTTVAVASTCIFVGCSNPEPEQQDKLDQTPLMTEQSNEAPLWLEEVEGEQALTKVNQWNETTLEKLMADKRYQQYFDAGLEIVNSKDKIPYGTYRGGFVYNFWQDEDNVRGMLRRTTLEEYAKAQPKWEDLLSIDNLAALEEKNWVYKGSTCFEGNYDRCLISLSDGGKDSVEIREWDHASQTFVDGGFALPEAKTDANWKDINNLNIATNWGEGSLTESGYPYIVKTLKRGQPLTEAKQVFSGEKGDVGVFPFSIKFDDKNLNMLVRARTFYESEYFWLPDDGSEAKQLPLPSKVSLEGVFKGQLVLSLNQQWSPTGSQQTFESGDLVSFDLSHWLQKQQIKNLQLIYHPDERSTVDGVSISANKVVLTLLENVKSNLYLYDFDTKWSHIKLAMPENGSMSVSSVNQDSDIIFVNQESFVAPDTLFKVDVKSITITEIKSIPARFDASDIVVEQFQATSKDGEKIPYFVVRQKDIKYDGSNPTLQYAYGGFQVSLKPSYSGILGKNWLEQGGVYVLANIRGGGEFGPNWHQAGLKTKRQVIYDDMIAVGEDIIAKKITSPENLGIMGGSNGGLLMGVMYTQRPDLWNAVVCQVPLLDMLRYHKLLAGASWVGEYGSPDIPNEREFLEKISPLHNIDPKGDYPSILFVTSTKDDRVHPGHARKMAYLLENYGHDFEYYENIDGGHSASANLRETAKRTALEYTFLSQKLMD